MKRVHLIIIGDVQGVGYRSWAVRQAKFLGVVGWVKNRPDGTVELVAEGPPDKLEKLADRCRKGPDVAWVERTDVTWEESAGAFADFSVLR